MPSIQEFTCTASNSATTTDDLAGPGRAIDNMFGYLGIRLELLLGKVSVKVGKGPVATARRIRRNRAEMIAICIPTSHWQYCHCIDCRLQDEFGLRDEGAVIRSPEILKRLHRRINKDCKRLVGYIGSSENSTQKQTIDSILDLSFWDGEVRAILKAHGAYRTISGMADINRRFRSKNREADIAFADSSRKALVSLDDGEVNAVLKEWVLAINLYAVSYDYDLIIKLELLWKEVSKYLWDAERAFLVMRILRTTLSESFFLAFSWSLILGSIKSSPQHFEWSECEALMCMFCDSSSSFHECCVSLICAWLFKNIGNMPRIFETRGFTRLINDDFRKVPRFAKDNVRYDIWFYCQMSQAILKGIRDEFGGELSLSSLRSRYPSQNLQAFLYDHVCPITTMVRNFVLNDYGVLKSVPDPKEVDFYSELANSVIASDCAVQAKAWRYADYFMRHDVYSCNMLLNALSQMTFNPPGGLAEFVEARRRQCIPEKSLDWTRYYRYRDSKGNVHIERSEWIEWNPPLDETIGLEVLEIPDDWKLEAQIGHGEVFSDTGLFPIAVPSDVRKRPTYLAEVRPSDTAFCTELRHSGRTYTAIKVGTKPEDLRIEVHCPHGKVLATVKELRVPVLRYAPEAYAEVLGVDAESLFITGPFSWKPSQVDKTHDPDDPRHRYRVLTIEEARTYGYLEEEIYPMGDWEVILPCQKEKRRSFYGVEEESKIDDFPFDESDNGSKGDEVGSCGDESGITESERMYREARSEPAECGMDAGASLAS